MDITTMMHYERVRTDLDQAKTTLKIALKSEKGSETERTVLEEYPDFMERTMTLYMAPEKTIQTYVDGLMYKGQEISGKEIGVDTAFYLIDVHVMKERYNNQAVQTAG